MTNAIISFNVFGDPVGAARPRFSNGHAYMPEKTRHYEAQVAKAFAQEAAKQGFNPADFAGMPVSVRIYAFFHIPDSLSRKKRDALVGAVCTKKPDADNLAKAVLDGLQKGGAFDDDKQVYSLMAVKRWTENEPFIGVAVIYGEGNE